jgi:hypothetical protein
MVQVRTGALAAAVLAAAVVVLPATAQQQKSSGPNAAQGAVPLGPTGQYMLAQQLYGYGKANNDVLAVIAAADILSKVPPRETTRPKTSDGGGAQGGEGVSVGDLPGVTEVLATARQLAGKNKPLLAMIDDLSAAGSRGRVQGPGKEFTSVNAGSKDTFSIEFKGHEKAEVAIAMPEGAGLRLVVNDENDREICSTRNAASIEKGISGLYCGWTPAWTGPFKVWVVNGGRSSVKYLIMTN